MTLIDDMADMLPEILVAQPGSEDGFGEWAASGAALNLACLIEGENRLVRDATGQEVTSSVQVTVDTNALTTTGHRYDLPSRFPVRLELKAIAIERASDELGAHHEVVMFP